MSLHSGVIADGDEPLWTPDVLGCNPVHWWDGTDSANQSLDPTSGKLSSWTDKIGGAVASQSTDSLRPAAPTSDGEVRFTGTSINLALTTMSRAYIEHTWFLLLFRINWSAGGMAAGGVLFAINGYQGSTGMNQPEISYTTSTKDVAPIWTNSNGGHSIQVNIPTDNEWYSLVARRDTSGAYVSLNGAAEQSVSGNTALPLVPTAANWAGQIGDFRPNNLDWGLDTLIFGQGDLSADDVTKLHAWAMWRRQIQSSQPAGSAYLRSKPFYIKSDVFVETPDSYATSGLLLGNETWDDSTQGTALDLSGFTQTFLDDFTDISSITDPTVGAGPWYAPAREDTSSAKFVSPGAAPTDTFTQYDSTTLQIQHQEVSTTWYTGHIQTVNSWGEGWTQSVPSGGSVYYEAKIALNNAAGWPTFWLYSQNRYKDTAASLTEIDIVEAYGDNATSQHQLHTTCFRHNAYRPQPGNAASDSHSPSKITNVNVAPWNVSSLFDGAGAPGTFHTYGCMIDETWVTFYFDGLVVSRFPSYPEALVPLYMLVSLQQQGSPVTPVQTYMWIDYVTAYSMP